MALIFPERENPPTALFYAQPKSAELGLLLAGLQLTPTHRFLTHAIMLETEVPNWMCNYSFCKRPKSSSSLLSPLFTPPRWRAFLLFTCICLSDGQIRLPSQTKGVGWRVEQPSHGRGQLEVLVHFPVFYVLSSRFHVEIEIFLF